MDSFMVHKHNNNLIHLTLLFLKWIQSLKRNHHILMMKHKKYLSLCLKHLIWHLHNYYNKWNILQVMFMLYVVIFLKTYQTPKISKTISLLHLELLLKNLWIIITLLKWVFPQCNLKQFLRCSVCVVSCKHNNLIILII